MLGIGWTGTTGEDEVLGDEARDESTHDRSQFCAFTLSDSFERVRNLNVILAGSAHVAAFLLHVGTLLFGLEVASAKGAPAGHCHAFGDTHRHDVPFEVAVGSGPASFVDDELRETMITGI